MDGLSSKIPISFGDLNFFRYITYHYLSHVQQKDIAIEGCYFPRSFEERTSLCKGDKIF